MTVFYKKTRSSRNPQTITVSLHGSVGLSRDICKSYLCSWKACGFCSYKLEWKAQVSPCVELMYSANRNKVILISYTKFVQCLVHGKAVCMITVSCQLNAASFPLAFEWDLFLQLCLHLACACSCQGSPFCLRSGKHILLMGCSACQITLL